MKKIKFFLGLVIIGFVALIVYQNRDYFFTKQALSLSFGVETWHWTALAVETLYYIGACFVIGFLLAGFMGLSSKFKARKTIKSLNATIEAHLEMISSLKKELLTFKNDPYIKENEPAAKTKADTSDQAPEEIIELPAETKKTEEKE